MINNLDKDRKKSNCFLLSISKQIKKTSFGKSMQSLFIMAFIISYFFQNSSDTMLDFYDAG